MGTSTTRCPEVTASTISCESNVKSFAYRRKGSDSRHRLGYARRPLCRSVNRGPRVRFSSTVVTRFPAYR